ncbi:hypothetical protein [Paenibacillus sp. FSL P2-0173]|uniref:hypothetical protein n=1 Tax=Paenibacillus sp. FSL P2-0173 TaxID=2921627 RepID=UPI0030F87BD4
MRHTHRKKSSAARKFFRNASIDTARQYQALKLAFPRSEVTLVREKLTWIGQLKPTELSQIYTVSIEYTLGSSPKVQVLDPCLRPRQGEKIPHMFDQKRLCLYYPASKEWNKNKWIHQTIIPWTSMWLYFYEIWHATGEWLGEGIHPEYTQSKTNRMQF